MKPLSGLFLSVVLLLPLSAAYAGPLSVALVEDQEGVRLSETEPPFQGEYLRHELLSLSYMRRKARPGCTLL